MKNKILFVVNKVPHYRLPLFNKLASKLNITFFLVNEISPVKGLRAKQIVSNGVGFGKFRIHLDLTKEIKSGKYSSVVMLPPDASHLIDNYLMYFSLKKERIPFIFWTERWNYFHLPIRDKISNFFHSILLRNASNVLVSGKKSREWVKSLGIKKEKIVTAPNASEIEYRESDMVKNKKSIAKKYSLEDKKVVLYLGRLINRKGVKYLIEAFSKLEDKDAVLMIVGGGDFYKLGEKSVEYQLKKQVEKLGLQKRIFFTGDIKHSETAAYYSLADIFVYPSITEGISEPWGLTLNEAMQFGLPVISTTAVGAAYDLIEENKNGFVVKEKDCIELKNAIEKLLNDGSLRIAMGKESIKKIRKYYNYDIMAKGFLGVLA